MVANLINCWRSFEPVISKMYQVYIFQSLKDNGYYVGYTSNLEKRVKEHNSGKTRLLKSRLPLKLIYFEEYILKSEAKSREKQIKSYKGGSAFLKLLGSPTPTAG